MFRFRLLIILATLVSATGAYAAMDLQGPVEIVISVADQRMALLCNGEVVTRYPVSTSKFGIGDSLGSYRTPLGHLRICDKIGEGLQSGAVIKHRSATGEVLQVNAPGRDPIVTRILWLEGLEEQNKNARCRSIYIHGTPEESRIGQPVSWGCIRMRSADVLALYDELPVGAPVSIIAEKLPRYAKYRPPELIAKGNTTPAPAPASAPAPVQIPAAAPAPVVAAARPSIASQSRSSRESSPHAAGNVVATIRWGSEYESLNPSNAKASAILKQSILSPSVPPVVITSRNSRQPQPEATTRHQPVPAVTPPEPTRETPKQAVDPVFPSEKVSQTAPQESSFSISLMPETAAPSLLLASASRAYEFAGFSFDLPEDESGKVALDR